MHRKNRAGRSEARACALCFRFVHGGKSFLGPEYEGGSGSEHGSWGCSWELYTDDTPYPMFTPITIRGIRSATGNGEWARNWGGEIRDSREIQDHHGVSCIQRHVDVTRGPQGGRVSDGRGEGTNARIPDLSVEPGASSSLKNVDPGKLPGGALNERSVNEEPQWIRMKKLELYTENKDVSAVQYNVQQEKEGGPAGREMLFYYNWQQSTA
ncbi:unnamed protein product [Pleuronectes platessa]|uniref:Uncharacterized protein n=1 Tax=Pleuronectes platessa TaxID=8262 RepID=A0A9N7YNH0_PLEPL|nr:unnamed protein product [Pleuronectes platessa]